MLARVADAGEAVRDAQSRAASAVKTRNTEIREAVQLGLSEHTVCEVAGISRSTLFELKKLW